MARKQGTKRILKEGLADHLDYRITPQKQTGTPVDRLIITIKNKILSMPGTDPGLDERYLQRMIAGVVAGHCDEALKIITTKGQAYLNERKSMPDDVLHNTVCVAVSFADQQLLGRLLKEGASLWTKTPFGYPLNVALRSESIQMLDFILPLRGATLTQLERESINNAIREVHRRIDWKRLRHHEGVKSVMKHFIRWCTETLSPTPKALEILLEWAIALEQHQCASTLLIGMNPSKKIHLKAARAAYFRHRPVKEVLEEMLRLRFLAKDEAYKVSDLYGHHSNYDVDWEFSDITVLNHAIYYINLNVAHMALTGERPDSPNGPPTIPESKPPLFSRGSMFRKAVPIQIALETAVAPLVKMLIQHNADPEGIDVPPWQPTTLEICQVHFGMRSPIWDMLVTALEAKLDNSRGYDSEGAIVFSYKAPSFDAEAFYREFLPEHLLLKMGLRDRDEPARDFQLEESMDIRMPESNRWAMKLLGRL